MKFHPLKVERQKRGWSQSKIAEALGTTVRTVSRWEQGIAVPSHYYRAQLCSLFGKNAKQLGLLSSTDEDNIEDDIFPLGIQPSSPSHVIQGSTCPLGGFLVDPAIPETLGNTSRLLGRSGLLARVKQYLFEGDNLALTALNGLPGIGKTALAVALANDEQVRTRFRHGILWTGLGPHPNVQGLLARWGKLLGIAPKDIENVNSRECWGRALRSAIDTRHLLLVIDDAWTTEDALAFQVGGAHCAHLLTTRLPQVAFTFAEQGAIVVPELGDADGLALLDSFVPQVVQQDPQGARTLVQAVGGLPLALTLMGKYLAAQTFTGQPRRLQAALTQLHDTEQRLHVSMPTALRERSPSLPADIPLSLHAAIAVSDQHLSPQAHATLCALSVFSPKLNSFSEEAALAVSQQPVETLDALWDAGLLESSGPERYTLHQTIADYAHSQVQDITRLEAIHPLQNGLRPQHPQGALGPYANALLAAQQRLVNYMLRYVQECEPPEGARQECVFNPYILSRMGLKMHYYDTLELEATNILTALDIAVTLGMDHELIQAAAAFHKILTANRDPQMTAVAQYGLAQVAALRGDVREARRLGEESLAGFEAIEHYWAEKARDLLHSLPEKEDASDETPSAKS
jgi:transcriptional regulator with XRE-family HTH domain